MKWSAAGVDGCRGGWVAAAFCRDELVVERFQSLQALFDRVFARGRVCVDMPIGLLDGPGARDCDRLARARLGRLRASSVFSPPIRSLLSCETYAEANHQSRLRTGRGLSIQSFNITPKIRELDEFLRIHRNRRQSTWESHPELVFAALNDGTVIQESKKTPLGRTQRRDLLALVWPAAEAVIDKALASSLRRDLAEDDILDAMACLVAATAKQVDYCPLKAPRDSRDLRMQLRLPKKSVGEGSI